MIPRWPRYTAHDKRIDRGDDDQRQQRGTHHAADDRDRTRQRYGDCCRDAQRRTQVDQKERLDVSSQARSQKDVLLAS